MKPEVRTCPDCNGTKVMERESARPRATPEGPRWETWLDACQLCGGLGEITVEPIDMDDLTPEEMWELWGGPVPGVHY
jgi:hypothetical protein